MFSKHKEGWQLVVGEITLILGGPVKRMMADGIMDRFYINILEGGIKNNHLTLNALSILKGNKLKEAMQQEKSSKVINLLRSWGGATALEISNVLSTEIGGEIVGIVQHKSEQHESEYECEAPRFVP